MTIKRMDHISVVVDDLPAAIAFFTTLGMALEGEMPVEGPTVDRLCGLEGVQADIAMMRTPDGHSKLELTKYHAPRRPAPSRRTLRPTRWACIASCSSSTTSTTPSPAWSGRGRSVSAAERRAVARVGWIAAVFTS